MLQPSFALVKRHEQDQYQVVDEKERRLQHGFEQIWLRIGTLEKRAQNQKRIRRLSNGTCERSCKRS